MLGIDTAGPVVGAALWTPEGVRSWSARVSRGADGLLLPALLALLEGGADTPDGDWAGPRLEGGLDLVAVTVGPGAFTGLRVGVAAALGIAVGRGVPVVPLSALEARAVAVEGERVLVMLDARKGRVYAGLFQVRDGSAQAFSAEADIHPVEALPSAPFIATGEGALVYAGLVTAAGGVLAPDADRAPAGDVARLGWLRRADALDAGQVALRYLRPPDAQIPADLRPKE